MNKIYKHSVIKRMIKEQNTEMIQGVPYIPLCLNKKTKRNVIKMCMAKCG